MDSQTLHLHAFASAKGGVGKSTLAVACATLLAAAPKRTVVLLDADLTGTSLADGLRLLAPQLPMQEGAPDFSARSEDVRWLTWAETQLARKERRTTSWVGLPPPPPFLNDLLVRPMGDRQYNFKALCWRHEREDRVLYFPSSPLPQDIDIALGWLYNEGPFRWIQRLAWLLDDMRKQIPELTDVVVDLPPGLFGFAHQVLALLSSLNSEEPLPPGFPPWQRQQWRLNPLLVTTPDSNDLAIAVEYRVAHRADLPELDLLLNRYTGSLSLQGWFGERYPELPGFYNELKLRVDSLPSLATVFINGRLELGSDEIHQLRRSLRLEDLT